MRPARSRLLIPPPALPIGTTAAAFPGTARAVPRAGHARQAPVRPSVDGRSRALNVEGAPQFVRWPRDRDPGEIQTAYEIEARDAPGAEVRNSGRARPGRQECAACAGRTPAPGASSTWRVRTWDRIGKRSPWSRSASIDTGIRAGDRHAHWTRRATGDPDACTLARRDFTAGRAADRAAPRPRSNPPVGNAP